MFGLHRMNVAALPNSGGIARRRSVTWRPSSYGWRAVAIDYALCVCNHSRSAPFMRVCQPSPPALNASTMSAS